MSLLETAEFSFTFLEQMSAGHFNVLGCNPAEIIRQEVHNHLAVDKAANSTGFIEFMPMIIRNALLKLIQTEQVREQVTEQVERLLMALGN